MGLSIQTTVTKKFWLLLSVVAFFVLVAFSIYYVGISKIASAMPGSAGSVVINEFSANGPSDWVELYNTTDQAIDLSGWQLRNTTAINHVNLAETISPHGFISVDFGNYLDMDTDTIRLLDDTATEINTVTYDISGPILYPGDGQSTARVEDGGATWAVGVPTRNITNVPDTTYPALTIARPANGELFGGPSKQFITVEALVSDERGLGVYHIDIDADGQNPGTKQDTLQAHSPAASVTINTIFNSKQLTDGSHTIYVSITDKAGNLSEDTRTINVDNEPPKVAVTSPTNTVVGGETLQITGSVTDNNALEEYSYQVLDANRSAISSTDAVTKNGPVENGLLGSWNIKDYPSGTYYVRVSAKDQAGNTSAPYEVSFVVDHTEPVVTLNLTSSAAPTASTPVSLQGNVKDHATLKLFVDDELLVDLTTNVDSDGNWQYVHQQGLAQGKHVLSVVATDQYGNVSNLTTSPLSAAEINVGSYVVPADGAITSNLTDGLSAPFVRPSDVSVVPSALEDAEKQVDTDVLGARTKNGLTVDQNAKTPAIAATEAGWRVFGTLWYWWLLLIALVAAASWSVVAFAKRRLAADVL